MQQRSETESGRHSRLRSASSRPLSDTACASFPLENRQKPPPPPRPRRPDEPPEPFVPSQSPSSQSSGEPIESSLSYSPSSPHQRSILRSIPSTSAYKPPVPPRSDFATNHSLTLPLSTPISAHSTNQRQSYPPTTGTWPRRRRVRIRPFIDQPIADQSPNADIPDEHASFQSPPTLEVLPLTRAYSSDPDLNDEYRPSPNAPLDHYNTYTLPTLHRPF